MLTLGKYFLQYLKAVLRIQIRSDPYHLAGSGSVSYRIRVAKKNDQKYRNIILLLKINNYIIYTYNFFFLNLFSFRSDPDLEPDPDPNQNEADQKHCIKVTGYLVQDFFAMQHMYVCISVNVIDYLGFNLLSLYHFLPL